MRDPPPILCVQLKSWGDSTLCHVGIFIFRAIQVSLFGEEEYVDKNGIRVTPAERFLEKLI